MKQIIGRILAGIGGVTVVLTALVVGLISSFSGDPVAKPAPDQMVLHLDFSEPLTESTAPDMLSVHTFLEGSARAHFFTMISALDKARKDDRVKAVVARFGAYQPSLAQAQELHRAILRLRDAGKPTYAFGTNYGDIGGGNRIAYLASAFEHIWLQPVGIVGLTGIGAQSFFGKSALESIGVTAHFRRRAEYKSVMENVSRDGYSQPVRDNMESLMKNLAHQVAAGIGQGRKMDEATVRDLMRQGPFTAEEALKAKLVTHIGYDDEIMKEIEAKVGADAESVGVGAYVSFAPQKKIKDKTRIALINAQGLITDLPPSGPRALAEEEIIDTDEVVDAFHAAAEEDAIKAIVFRVNSPGGSPAASESIRRAVVTAKESKKPVFVSMGDVAASGGYWIAMNADRIYAEGGTITGSIGVVVGKMVFSGLLQKIGIKLDEIKLDDNSRLFSPFYAFSSEDEKRIDAMLDSTYAAFTKNVAAARKIPEDKIPAIAKGRVFTGEQAVAAGLVDEVGGIDSVLAGLRKELKLAPDAPLQLEIFPPPEPAWMAMAKMLEDMGGQMMLSRLGAWLGIAPQRTEWTRTLRHILWPSSPLGAVLPPVYEGIR